MPLPPDLPLTLMINQVSELKQAACHSYQVADPRGRGAPPNDPNSFNNFMLFPWAPFPFRNPGYAPVADN